MRAALMLMPAALIGGIVPAAQAKIYMSVEDAQRLMFPGQTLQKTFVTLDQDQYNAVVDEVGAEPYSRNVRAWRTKSGDWLVLDQVPGKDDWITYAVSVDAKGVVRQLEVLECLENYDGITNAAWRTYFRGRQRKFDIRHIPIISGSTLSSENMAVGVRRVLATIAIVLRPSAE